MLLAGEVDAAGVDSNTLRLWQSDYPSLASRVRVLASWGPLPVYPVVLNTRLSRVVREGVATALLNMGESERWSGELAKYGLKGFIPVTEDFYRREREIIDVLDVADKQSISR